MPVSRASPQIAGKAGRPRFAVMLRGRSYTLVSDEADLSAEEAQARPSPRVPRPHGHARWALDVEAAARQRPQAPHSVAMEGPGGRRRSGRGRLSRSAEFDRVYREGRSHANRYLVVYSFPREGNDEDARLGVSVGRKVGGAVERNRVKRLLREAFWASADTLPDGHDFVVVARPDSGELAGREGEEGVERALRELLEKAGFAQAEKA
jgi:ribonuclease P protein component